MDYDEQVVHTNSQDQERHHFNDDECNSDPNQVEETDGANDSQQHYQNTNQAYRQLQVHLHRERGAGERVFISGAEVDKCGTLTKTVK